MRNFYTVDIIPDAKDLGAAVGTAYTDNDVFFGWQKFEIPKGPARITSISYTMAGKDGVAQTDIDFGLYFAKSIDGNAPADFGTPHAPMTNAIATTFRRNIFNILTVDESDLDDADNHLISYKVAGSGDLTSYYQHLPVLQGDPSYPGTTGYQTLWVASIVSAAVDFDTSIVSNEAGSANVAANMTGAPVTVTTSGTNPNIIFQPGDQIVGSTGGPTCEFVELIDATSFKVKNISEQIDNAELFHYRYPLRITLGFQY